MIRTDSVLPMMDSSVLLPRIPLNTFLKEVDFFFSGVWWGVAGGGVATSSSVCFFPARSSFPVDILILLRVILDSVIIN